MDVFALFNLSPFAVLAILVMAVFVMAALKKFVRDGHLQFRQTFTDEEFGATFFSGNRADTAVRVRRVLAKNLDTNLDGVRPEDRLDDDLDASIGSNVYLFFDLETEFDIDTGVHDLETFEKNAAGLTTFANLVDFVHQKRSDPRARRKPDDVSDEEYDAWDAIGYAWFTGIGLTVVASIVDSDLLMKVALTIAFAPLVLGITSQLLFAAREMANEIRSNGIENIRQHPFGLVIWLSVTLPFALWAAWLTWVLFSLYFGGD